MARSKMAFAMVVATAANVVLLLVSPPPTALKELAHTAIMHPDFLVLGAFA
jgi:hypothetical protein